MINDRRAFLKKSIFSSAGLFLSGLYSCSTIKQSPPPNIFFAIADDWGWPHASIYGEPVVKTPTFDAIARNGILFTNAFVSAPSCTPSRNAILTGQHHWRLGPGANLWSHLPEQYKTFPNLLEDAGYHAGHYRKAWGPGRDRERPAAGKRYENLETFLNEQPEGSPFCFWFGAWDPHRTYEWRSGVESGLNPDKVKVPPCFPDVEEVRIDICDYFFEVQRFDREVGEALKLLEEAGELENTIVIMTGDNGWPFPRGKTNLYDLGTHMPLAVQWPAEIKPGRGVNDFVSFTDFAPTFLEAAGMKALPEMTGRSLLPVFRSRQSGNVDSNRNHALTGRERHTPAQADTMEGYPMRALRTHRYLYIRNFKPELWPAGGPDSMRGPAYSDIDDGPTKAFIVDHKNDPEYAKYFELACGKRPAEELYDLQKDPDQLVNVAAEPEYEQPLLKLRAWLDKRLSETGDPRSKGDWQEVEGFPYYGQMEGRK